MGSFSKVFQTENEISYSHLCYIPESAKQPIVFDWQEIAEYVERASLLLLSLH